MVSTVTIREFFKSDSTALRSIDTSFSTDHIYSVITIDSALQLARIPLTNSIVKKYELSADLLAGTTSFVALKNGCVCGLIAVAFESWHRRLVIRHFYVDRNTRHRGVGRQLIARAIEHGQDIGALNAWVETSNLNSPGIAAYFRLGFEICGFDTTFYAGTEAKGEFAVFLARPI